VNGSVRDLPLQGAEHADRPHGCEGDEDPEDELEQRVPDERGGDAERDAGGPDSHADPHGAEVDVLATHPPDAVGADDAPAAAEDDGDDPVFATPPWSKRGLA